MRSMQTQRGIRTTLSLDPEVLNAARRLAAARSQSLGRVVSDLARSALEGASERNPADRDGFPVFRVSKGSPALTLDEVKRDEDRAQ